MKPFIATTTDSLQTTASESPKAKSIMPERSTIAAGLYHEFAVSCRRFGLASTLALSGFSLICSPALAQTALPQPAPVPWPAPVPAPRTAGEEPSQEERFSRRVAPGIEFTTIARREAGRPLQLFIVHINLHPENADHTWKLQVATAEHSVLKSATVKAMSRRENAVVAINGGYFAFGGAALGAVKTDHKWIRLPLKNRTALGIDVRGGILIDNLHASARATLGRQSLLREINILDSQSLFTNIAIDNLNGYAPENGVSLLTTRFATTYQLRPDEVALEVAGGVVRARVEAGVANVREEGWTLIARGAGREAVAEATAGQAATWQVQTPGAWQKYAHILGAGPRLLRNGKIETTEVIEEFRPDVLARGPRSAIGVDRNGHVWIVAADGRAPEYSMGLTLAELAGEMQKLGVTDAICLDGGGSTALTVNSILVNRPSDGSERRVPNALIVTSEDKVVR